MSRSYKHTCVCTSENRNGYKKRAKKWCNKKVRKYNFLKNGKMYKKLLCSWIINEQKSMITLREWIMNYEKMKTKWYYNEKNDKGLEHEINYWYKCYYRK